jgi:hypothetical protein
LFFVQEEAKRVEVSRNGGGNRALLLPPLPNSPERLRKTPAPLLMNEWGSLNALERGFGQPLACIHGPERKSIWVFACVFLLSVKGQLYVAQ